MVVMWYVWSLSDLHTSLKLVSHLWEGLRLPLRFPLKECQLANESWNAFLPSGCVGYSGFHKSFCVLTLPNAGRCWEHVRVHIQNGNMCIGILRTFDKMGWVEQDHRSFENSKLDIIFSVANSKCLAWYSLCNLMLFVNLHITHSRQETQGAKVPILERRTLPRFDSFIWI